MCWPATAPARSWRSPPTTPRTRPVPPRRAGRAAPRGVRGMGLPIRPVVRPVGAAVERATSDEVYTAPGLLVDSGEYTGLTSEEASAAIGARVELAGMGKRAIQYHLRDWLISRQRYWG